MKRTIPVILLCTVLMTGCYEDYYDYDTPETTQTSSPEEESISTGDISTEGETIAEEGSDMISPEDAPTADQGQMETEAQETEAVSDIMGNEQPAASETTEETETIAQTTEATSCTTESAVQTETTAATEQPTEPVTETEPVITTEAPTDPEPVPSQNDYEKALAVYEYIRENGHGTCVNYACQTYEKCLAIGLPCYLVWTEAGIYGHVANTVCVNGIWFIMDTQGGFFLSYNYGFTEVVDRDESHIGDAGMLSNYSYEELFG